MSIEKMEKTRDDYYNFNTGSSRDYYIGSFMTDTINTLKSQSDAIADLRKELAKKEDIFDVNEVKEVRNLNEFICGTCTHYDGKYCMLHLEYGEVCEKDTCKDYAEVLIWK